MKRNINLEEISDGKLYTANDMVKTDCRDCIGCSDCCRGMGESIILDPMDIWRFSANLDLPFSHLLAEHVELHVTDGMVLPNLKLGGDGESCSFLNLEGRCSIHPYRPGICRLFPLGRIYEEKGFRYFLQIHECPKTDKSKIKIRKWLGISDIKIYEQYITDWHFFLNHCEEALPLLSEEQRKLLSLYVLKTFYETAYPKEDFYTEFYRRLEKAKDMFGFR